MTNVVNETNVPTTEMVMVSAVPIAELRALVLLGSI